MADKYDAFLDSEDAKLDAFLDDDAVPPAPTSLTPEQIAEQKRKSVKSFVRGEEPILSRLQDIGTGMASVPLGLLRRFAPELANKLETGRDKESGYYIAGQVLDPAALAVGGGAMKAAQAIPRLGAIGAGMLGGAAGGANIAALSGQGDVGTAGLLGGVVGGVIPGATRVAGGAIDWAKGYRPKLEAAKIFRSTLGESEEAVRRSLQNAPLSAGGTQRDVAQVIYKDAPDQALALLESAKGYAPTAPDAARKLAESQAAAQQAMLGRVAGGTTQEASLAAQQRMGQALNQQLNPERVANLTAANIYNEAAARDLPVAALYKANSMFPHSAKTSTGGFPKNVEVTTGQSELYASAAKVLEDKLGSLQKNGLKPLTIDPIIRKIDSILATPGQRGQLNQEYLQAVKDELLNYSRMSGGTLNAFDLHTLRKEGLNNAIDRISRGIEDASGLKRNLAKNVLPNVKNAIDDAIEEAGGKGWKSYLNKFSMGMSDVDRAKLGQMALKMSKDDLVKLARGDMPEAVEKAFGTGSVSFAKEMGQKGTLIREVARQYARDAEIAARGKSTEAQEVLKSTLGQNLSKFRVPPMLTREAVIANATLREIEGKLNREALAVIGQMRTDPAKALDLLNTLPAEQRNKVLQYIYTSRASAPAITGTTALYGE